MTVWLLVVARVGGHGEAKVVGRKVINVQLFIFLEDCDTVGFLLPGQLGGCEGEEGEEEDSGWQQLVV